MITLTQKLQHMNACKEAINTIKNKSVINAWNSCKHDKDLMFVIRYLYPKGCLTQKYRDLAECAYFYGARIARKYKLCTVVRNLPIEPPIVNNAVRSIRLVIPTSVIVRAFTKYGHYMQENP